MRSFILSWRALTTVVKLSIAGPKFWRTFIVFGGATKQAITFSGECICGSQIALCVSCLPTLLHQLAHAAFLLFFFLPCVSLVFFFFECMCIPSAALLLLNGAIQTLVFEARRTRLGQRNLTGSTWMYRGSECQLGNCACSDS